MADVPEAPEHEAPAETVTEVADRQQADESWMARLGDKMARLGDKLDTLIDKISGLDSKPDTPTKAEPDPAPDVKAEARKAVQELQGEEKRRADRESALDARINAAVEAAVKVKEKAPREFSPVTRFFWGDDE